jgi:small subunit ribosomal protein S16
MATRIRLRRMGSNKRPFYRVVVADQRSPRDGRFIEAIGKYHPLNDPSVIEIDEGRALYWLRVGAQPSNQVRNLMSKIGIWETFVSERPGAAAVVGKGPKPERPQKPKLSKKAQAKAAEAQQEADAEPPADVVGEPAEMPAEPPEAAAEPAETGAEPAEAGAEPAEAGADEEPSES